MPLNAYGWTLGESEKLVELIQPNTFLYNILDPSRRNILARETTWQQIAQTLNKPVEECKKRWRGLRDSYMRSKRVGGAVHKTKTGINEKLQFLDSISMDNEEVLDEGITEEDQQNDDSVGEEVITDNQEYYEITVVEDEAHAQQDVKPLIKILPKTQDGPKKTIRKSNAGRKKSIPLPRNLPPVKILPKPLLMSSPKIVRYVEDQKTPEQRSQVIDKLIEKALKENTNEIDVFFRSMAASVKKLQPNLIPKVKMEVCNVIAKYEMQCYERYMQ